MNKDQHERAAHSQKDYFETLAARIEAGEPMTSAMDRRLAAGAIRALAASIPTKPKGKQGPPPKFCHQSEALTYAAYRVKGVRHGEVLAEIADRVGVSEQAVDKAIKKHRAGAFAMFDMDDPGNQ